MKHQFLKLVFVFLFISGFLKAQFNTLMPVQPKKSENEKILEAPKDPSKQNKNKKSWGNIFKITTKSDLKNETKGSKKWLTSQIDSLKTLIKKYSDDNNRKEEYAKMKDSLLMQSLNRNQQQKKSTKNKNPFAVYDFVEEPKESISKIVMPLRNKINITSPYGTRVHPISGTKKLHNGIDLKANYENVYAVMDGIVTSSGWDSKGGGNYIKVKHFNRFETTYMHLSEIYYKAGEYIKAGFIIAKSGNTGNSTGPHLHFTVKEYGKIINPAHFLNDLIKVNNLIAIYNE